MSEEKKSIAPSNESPAVEAKPFVFDLAKANGYIGEVKAYLDDFAGKKNHNPYFVIVEKITPLEVRIGKGERTKELFDAIMAMKKTPPIFNNLVENEKAAAIQSATKIVPPRR